MSARGLRLTRSRSLGVASFLALWVLGTSALVHAQTLSADEVVSRAAANNPTLRAALLEARSARHTAEAERAARAPVFTATLQGEHSEMITRAGLSGVAAGSDATSRSVQNGVSADAQVSYTTEEGTQLSLGTRTGTTWDSTTWTGPAPLPNDLSVGPTYSAQAYAGARKPLLQGGGSDVELAPLHQAQARARAAQSRERETASQTALAVLQAYWELWYAERAVAVQERAHEVAEALVEDARVRATTLGTGSQVDVLQFQTSLAGIAEALSQARAERENRAIELGRVLGLGPEESAALAARGELPEFGPVPSVDALGPRVESSPTLEALRADLDAARVRVATTRDADQVRLDLFANGSVGTVWDEGSGFSLSGGRPAFVVLGGVELQLPLGSGRFAADAAAARADLEAAEARYRAELDAVRARTGSLVVSARAASNQVALSAQTAATANQLADAERQRLALGTTTPRDVVSAEQTARESELRRLRAIVSHASTRLSLEHQVGMLLDRYAGALGRADQGSSS